MFRFHKPKYRRYNYQPRYYDPDLEDLAVRKARIQRELQTEEEEKSKRYNFEEARKTSMIRGSFRQQIETSEQSSWRSFSTNLAFAVGVVGSIVMYRYADGYENWAVAALLGSFAYFVWRKVDEYRNGL